MLAVILFSIVGLLANANGLSFDDSNTEELAGLDEDVQRDVELSHDGGHCLCSKHECWCHGTDDGVSIHALFMVNECRRKRCSKTLIVGTFFVGGTYFMKIFKDDQFEDFCETVKGKRFCFRIDIKDSSNPDLLAACLTLSRPHKVDMGCFKLPLMTSEPVEVTSEEVDMAEAYSEDISDDSRLLYIDDEDKTTGDSFSEPSIDMEIPLQMDDIVGRRHRHCMCCEHGCICHAVDDGYKVVVILTLDEFRNDKDEHAVIQGEFLVGKDHFVRRFDAGKLRSFCQTENGKRFCFRIRTRRTCRRGIRTCMKLTRPRRINLGCFWVPLLATDSECYED